MKIRRCKGAKGVNVCIADYEVKGDASGPYCAEHIMRMRNQGKAVQIVKSIR